LTTSCTGAAPCWVTAVYSDANFGGIMRRSRSQSRPSLTVTASSQTAQRESFEAYSWPVFVAGEPLMVTVSDYVVDSAAGIPMHF
jgi:hypothetical protein